MVFLLTVLERGTVSIYWNRIWIILSNHQNTFFCLVFLVQIYPNISDKNKGMTDTEFQKDWEGWDIDKRVFKEFFWNMFKNLLKTDCSLFDEYVYDNVRLDLSDSKLYLIRVENDQRITKEH